MASFFQKPLKRSDIQNTLPWIEKYRPKTVDDVAYQEEVISTLKNSLDKGSLPHLLFYGPPGTGKTSTILALARQLFGLELYKQRIMELNASDERGIDIIRSKVKDFAQVAVASVDQSGHPVPPFKIIILDEADSMTSDAQSALRRTMETHSKVTRFCLICNYISRIIEPIASRCAKFRFKPLEASILSKRLRYICNEEKKEIEDSAVNALALVSEGDLRKAITLLQSASRVEKKISSQTVLNIAGVMDKDKLNYLLKACQSNSFEQVQNAVTDITLCGFAVAQVLAQIQIEIIAHKQLTDIQKANILLTIAEADKCLVDGADEFLQLLNCCSKILRVFSKP